VRRDACTRHLIFGARSFSLPSLARVVARSSTHIETTPTFCRRALIKQNNVTSAFCRCAQLDVLTQILTCISSALPRWARNVFAISYFRDAVLPAHKQINFSLFDNKYLCKTQNIFLTFLRRQSKRDQTSKAGVEGKTLRQLWMQFCVQRVAPVSLCRCVVFYPYST
jgi:hypothetical protein